MENYKHTVQYYETDCMGIAHHSNYVRWMEEARIDYLKKIGLPYDMIEKKGIVSPVTAIDCKYKSSTAFADEVDISVSISEFKGIVLKFEYIMKKQDGQVVFIGHSEHCFLNSKGKIVILKNEYPEINETLLKNVQ